MYVSRAVFEEYVYNIAAKKIFRHTVQLLVQGGKFGYKPWGTGVLAKINEKYLIFTAAHVTIPDENLFIHTPKGFLLVQGDVTETDLEKDKNLDLSFIILDDIVGEALEEVYEFIPAPKIRPYHQMEEETKYVVMGYPEKNIRLEGNNIISGALFYLLQGAKEAAYDFHKFSKEGHFLLPFAGKGIDLANGQKSKVDPEPYGISGCGLWLITANSKEGKIDFDYHLIGIMTMVRKNKFHVLVGHRIELLIETLIQIQKFNIIRPQDLS